MQLTFVPALNEGPDMFHDYNPDTAVLQPSGSYRVNLAVEDDDIEGALEFIYRALNIGDAELDAQGVSDTYRGLYEARSLSVGDVVFVQTGEGRHVDLRAFAVASLGFTEVDALEASYRTFSGMPHNRTSRASRRQARIRGLRDVVSRTGNARAADLLEEEIRRAERNGEELPA